MTPPIDETARPATRADRAGKDAANVSYANISRTGWLPFSTTQTGRRPAKYCLLVARHRVTCPWYLRPDYQAETVADALRVLDATATNGDLKAFQEAEEIRRWLSRDSRSPSVA